MQSLEQRPLPCAQLQTAHGNFFAMQPGGSSDPSKVGLSDLTWISVDDLPTWDIFSSIFDDMGVARVVEPLVDCAEGVRLYSAFYVVRSFCLEPDLHVDWPDGAGTNAFTLLTPLEDYSSSEGFHLLYEDNCKDNYEDNCEDSSEDNCEDNYEDNYEDSSAGAASSEATGQPAQLRQYRYSEGEAIVFGSRFRHSTEPGRAASGPCSPSVLLCFTFGSDRPRFYEEHIAPAISGYQSRVLVHADGSLRLTELGQYLEQHEEAAATVAF